MPQVIAPAKHVAGDPYKFSDNSGWSFDCKNCDEPLATVSADGSVYTHPDTAAKCTPKCGECGNALNADGSCDHETEED